MANEPEWTPCNTCEGDTAPKAFLCPHCGMLLRPNYAVVLAMTGVWFFGVTFGLLWLAMKLVMG